MTVKNFVLCNRRAYIIQGIPLIDSSNEWLGTTTESRSETKVLKAAN